jgi:regulatory protein
MRITRIESQKKRPDRRSIFADGKFVAGVSAETLLRLGLRTGDELSPEKLEALQAVESLHGARQTALRFLSHRPRTVREVRDKLREKEFSDDEITSTLEHLQQSGLLNDPEFARMFIRDALAIRPRGRLALKQKLLLLGVDRAIVDTTLDEAFQEVSQETLALEAAQKFTKRLGVVRNRESADKLRQRISQFLARRGFTWDTIRTVIPRLLPHQPMEKEQ